jgi:RNA polymerase sigma-70 factor (ECF subfamily)
MVACAAAPPRAVPCPTAATILPMLMTEPREATGPDRLYEAATAGDMAAFDQLLERYLPQLHAFVRVRLGGELRGREASVDVVQSVCRQLVASRSAFDFRGEERFRAWMFTAALNKIREKHRFHQQGMRTAEHETSDDAALLAVAHMLTPSQEAIGQETAAALAAALAALPEDHREVITLSRLVGLPHRVVAEVMDRSEEATRQLLGRALVRMTRELRARGIHLGGSESV